MKPYYTDGAVTLYCGDCREVLPTLPAIRTDFVFADPPFSVPVKYHDTEGTFPRSWGDLAIMEPFFADVFRELARVTRRTGQVYICCDDESYPVFFKAGYPVWPQSHLLVWYKPTGRRGRGWLHSHELVLHQRTPETEYAEGFRQDVVGIMPVRTLDRQHPAQKPGELVSFLAAGLPGENRMLLDPFCGSGIVLRYAKDNGHRAVGIEIEERYCEVAAKRLSQAVLPFPSEAP